MKYLILIFTMLLAVACGAQTPKEKQNKTPWPIEPKNDKVEYMIYLDSINYTRMGEPRNIDDVELRALAEMSDKPTTPEKMKEELSKAFADAEELWHKFVWLCNEGREEEAIKLYRDNRLNIDLALYDSEVRMAFHDEVVGILAYDHLPTDEARELMIACFQFDFSMIGIQYATTRDIELYGGLYDYALQILDTLYEQTDHYADMITYIDSWVETVKAVRYHPSIDVTALSRKGYVYNAIGDYEKAASSYSEAKWLVEKAITDGESSPALTDWLDMLNEQITQCQATLAQVSSNCE